nr:N-acetylmuramoyl-L-alanine amidase [uncultured Mediterraneibacter sp.]
MRRKLGDVAAIIALAAIIWVCHLFSTFLESYIDTGYIAKETSKFTQGEPTIILDPGHGGIDAGKTGVNGAQEKEINLKIAMKIKTILSEEGLSTVMTRIDDERLAESQVEDLKARTDIMNAQNPSLVVSIHQNSYHDEGVSGAQVFYHSKSEEGQLAAQAIQEQLNKINPDNTKKIKANDTYYILKNTDVPVVIVECGFLSNYEEAEKLSDEAYQQTVAEAIAEGIKKFCF